MRLGIDLGTTRTVVARVDRGNYPVLSFPDAHGDPHEFVPSVVALEGDELVYGYAAEAAGHAGAPVLRSFKRVLGDPETTPATQVDVGGRSVLLLDLLTGFLAALREEIARALVEEGDGLDGEDASDGEPASPAVPPLEVVVSVPAHAHSAQRFATLEAFRRAEFDVLGMVNEPSAAGFEFTHRQPRSLSSRRTQVIVYDLGGGTFDASLVRADGTRHEVLGSTGVNRLGGDDFDEVLADVAVRTAGTAAEGLRRADWRALVEDCREAKERLTPQTRRIALEVGGQSVVVGVEDFYEAASPLVEQSVAAMEPLVGRLDVGSIGQSLANVAGIYLVGGGSGLPLVPRVLRERFGRRVHRSPYPGAATAIGLAIAADPASGFTLTDRLSRGFGVFRERDAGRGLAFDQIFSPDHEVPVDGVATATRRYVAAHNVGWFRYVEYTEVDGEGEPRGELVPFAEVLFPYDSSLRHHGDLADVAVERREGGPQVEERYTIDARGIVEVTITDLTTGYVRTYGLSAR